jgi:hypothetical protein
MLFNFINEMGYPVQVAVNHWGKEVPMLNQELSQCEQPIKYAKVQELMAKYDALYFDEKWQYHPKNSIFNRDALEEEYHNAYYAIKEVRSFLEAPGVIVVDAIAQREQQDLTFTVEARPW